MLAINPKEENHPFDFFVISLVSETYAHAIQVQRLCSATDVIVSGCKQGASTKSALEAGEGVDVIEFLNIIHIPLMDKG